jgi:hypothetical protein
MKAVCEALGVARSHVHARVHRPKDWRDGRMNRTPAPNEELLVEIRQHIADLPICRATAIDGPVHWSIASAAPKAARW